MERPRQEWGVSTGANDSVGLGRQQQKKDLPLLFAVATVLEGEFLQGFDNGVPRLPDGALGSGLVGNKLVDVHADALLNRLQLLSGKSHDQVLPMLRASHMSSIAQGERETRGAAHG